MSLFPGWRKRKPTEREAIQQAFVREQGASDITFDALWNILLEGRNDYATRVDDAGRTCDISELMIMLCKPQGYTESGQPWIYNIRGEEAYSYFTPNLGMSIYLADPQGLRHEMLHYLDYKLHPDVIARYSENGAPVFRYAIIGHGGEGDPVAV